MNDPEWKNLGIFGDCLAGKDGKFTREEVSASMRAYEKMTKNSAEESKEEADELDLKHLEEKFKILYEDCNGTKVEYLIVPDVRLSKKVLGMLKDIGFDTIKRFAHDKGFDFHDWRVSNQFYFRSLNDLATFGAWREFERVFNVLSGHVLVCEPYTIRMPIKKET